MSKKKLIKDVLGDDFENYEKCWLCSDSLISKYIFTLQLPSGEYCGLYCSKDCADSDAVGPRLRDAAVIKVKV